MKCRSIMLKWVVPLLVAFGVGIYFFVFFVHDREDVFKTPREKMVEEQIIARGIKDKNVLEAMLKVPRHEFVSEPYKSRAYEDTPLPIGLGSCVPEREPVIGGDKVIGVKRVI